MGYREYLLISSAFGALPSFIFVTLYAFLDRPKFHDRYAAFIFVLGIVAFVSLSIPFILTLTADPGGIVAPTSWYRWAISIIIRSAAGGLMWWLLWIYLTPKRAKIRLGRYGSMHNGNREGEGGVSG